jgi:hypothetical protein
MPTGHASAKGSESSVVKAVAKADVAPPSKPVEAQGDEQVSSERPVEAARVLPVSVSAAAPRSTATPPPDSAVPLVGPDEVAREVVVADGQSATSAPTVFKPIGYVEKADGQVEAIIMQENDVQVVHTGDLIAGRYRVTKISPEAVQTVDDSQVQPGMVQPAGLEAKNSIGYVEQADGKTEAIVADGDSVRLVQQASTVVMAQSHPIRQEGVGDVPAQASVAPAPVVRTASLAVLTASAGSAHASEAQAVRPVAVEASAPTTPTAAADSSAAVAVAGSVGTQDSVGDAATSVPAVTVGAPVEQVTESSVRM